MTVNTQTANFFLIVLIWIVISLSKKVARAVIVVKTIVTTSVVVPALIYSRTVKPSIKPTHKIKEGASINYLIIRLAQACFRRMVKTRRPGARRKEGERERTKKGGKTRATIMGNSHLFITFCPTLKRMMMISILLR